MVAMQRKSVSSAIRKFLIFGVISLLIGSVSPAHAVTYDCRVTKVETPNPYLPERIVLVTDKRFLDVTVDTIEIENVKTAATPAEVVYRGTKRLRLSWSSLDYELIGRVPQGRLKGYGHLKPEQFSYQLSLERSGERFRATVDDVLYNYSHGVARGRCSIIE